MQLGLSTRVAAELELGLNLDTNSRRDKFSSELRTARPKRDIATSIQLESTESTVITTRSHLIFAVRECFEQMHRGDHFIFKHPSNASSWNEFCIRKPIPRSSEAGGNVFLGRREKRREAKQR